MPKKDKDTNSFFAYLEKSREMMKDWPEWKKRAARPLGILEIEEAEDVMKMEDKNPNFKVRLIDGKLYDPWSPTGDVPSPETVAYSLSNLCRYGGATTRFYSVAEHSIWVALACFPDCKENLKSEPRRASCLIVQNAWKDVVEETRLSKDDALLALLGLIHDAPEGCGLVDIPRPILNHSEMAAYKIAHMRCMSRLISGWKIPMKKCLTGDEVDPWTVVKRFDEEIVAVEAPIRPFGADDKTPENPWPWLDLKNDFLAMTPEEARRIWSAGYRELSAAAGIGV